MRVIISRHGQTDWNLSGRLGGSSDEPRLSTEGKEQALRIAELYRNAGIDTVFSSPSTRALETAGPLAEALGKEIIKVPELAELDFGCHEGEMIKEVMDKIRLMKDDLSFCWPGGESYLDVLRRQMDFWRRYIRGQTGVFYIQTHGGPFRVLLALLVRIKFLNAWAVTRISAKNEVVYEINEDTCTCSWRNVFTGETGEEVVYQDEFK